MLLKTTASTWYGVPMRTCLGAINSSTRTSGSSCPRPSGTGNTDTPSERAIRTASAAEATFSLPSLSSTNRLAPSAGKLAALTCMARATLVALPSTSEAMSGRLKRLATPCSRKASAPNTTNPAPSCGRLAPLTALMKSSACRRTAALTLCDRSSAKTTLACS